MNYDLYLVKLKGELVYEEKSETTINKYIKDINDFISYLNNREIDKDILIEYKKYICINNKPATVNKVVILFCLTAICSS